MAGRRSATTTGAGLALLLALAHAPAGGQGPAPPRATSSVTLRTEATARLHAPHHFTKLRQYVYWQGRYALGGGSGESAAFRFQVRAYDDRVYDATGRYPPAVEADEEREFSLREAFITFPAGRRWDLRVGWQQVVWGEAVGLFVADVVNPKDYREFLLRDFADIRIPLVGVDALYSLGDDRVLEVFWSPEVRFSRLPVAGAEFAPDRPPPPAGVTEVFVPVQKPAATLANSHAGIRYSFLQRGLDAAVFYQRAYDDLPAVSKRLTVIDGAPNVLVSLVHPRVQRFGVTASKPVGDGVWKAEAVYTTGGLFEAKGPTPALPRDALSAMVGATYPASSYSVDIQVFTSAVLGSAKELRSPAVRTGLLSLRFADDASLRRLRPEVLLVLGLNRKDIWFRPRFHYRTGDASTLTLGLDWLAGPRDTLFGPFRDASRAQVQWIRHL